MRQRLNPWVVVVTAALTFGSLMAFIGPRSFGPRYWGHHGYDRGGHCESGHFEKAHKHSQPDSVGL
ncbi:hypothetical protein [Spirosoma daeguense]